MVRVTTQDEAEVTRVKIEGRIAGSDVNNLRTFWHLINHARPHSPILIDLTNVTFVDEAGKRLLAEMHRHGDKLFAVGLMMKAIVEDISRDG